jgi:hypothetical protein
LLQGKTHKTRKVGPVIVVAVYVRPFERDCLLAFCFEHLHMTLAEHFGTKQSDFLDVLQSGASGAGH